MGVIIELGRGGDRRRVISEPKNATTRAQVVLSTTSGAGAALENPKRAPHSREDVSPVFIWLTTVTL